jgi:prephenate dehydratase
VLDALRKHEIDLAFVATDLLLSNIHHAALNQMVAFRLKMVGEVVAEEDVNVCALPGTEPCDADSVVSDWRTLQRYEEYIVQLEMQYNRTIYRQVAWDSSAGCRLVKEEEAEKTLVLCTASAAVNHGLVVLQRRLPGSPTHTRYTIIGRYGTSSLEFGGAPPSSLSRARCTLLVKGTARAILDIISAFAFRGLEILSFHTRDDEEQHLYGIDNHPATNAN